jgi:muramoyltetrapeptide carboxypeptidase
MMNAPKLKFGDTIGIICPSHIYVAEHYETMLSTIRSLGFNIKLGANVAKCTDGYLASAEERAADLNDMVLNRDVKMILFGGGNGASEILPYIDYDNIRRNPKLFSSYSDGTSILNAITSQTDLITYYGAGTGIFNTPQPNPFDWKHFETAFMKGFESFNHGDNWRTLKSGNAKGILIGGYLSLFVHMLANRYYKYDKSKRYILFVETHEKFNDPAEAAVYFAFLEQAEFFNQVDAMIVGTYSQWPHLEYLNRLERVGEKRGIPVVYSDSFGHGERHGIFPIGIVAAINTDKKELNAI